MTAVKSKTIWKMRTIKNYPEAHNHIYVGEVLDIEGSYVRLRCRTYHFSKSVNGVKDIRIGDIGIRIIPWSRIEIINELAAAFDYEQSKLGPDDRHSIVLSDGKLSYTIASSYEGRY